MTIERLLTCNSDPDIARVSNVALLGLEEPPKQGLPWACARYWAYRTNPLRDRTM
jgi:hypothetical protein